MLTPLYGHSSHVSVVAPYILVTNAEPKAVEGLNQRFALACLMDGFSIHDVHRCPFATVMYDVEHYLK